MEANEGKNCAELLNPAIKRQKALPKEPTGESQVVYCGKYDDSEDPRNGS
jgi:hypothetical protein